MKPISEMIADSQLNSAIAEDENVGDSVIAIEPADEDAQQEADESPEEMLTEAVSDSELSNPPEAPAVDSDESSPVVVDDLPEVDTTSVAELPEIEDPIGDESAPSGVATEPDPDGDRDDLDLVEPDSSQAPLVEIEPETYSERLPEADDPAGESDLPSPVSATQTNDTSVMADAETSTPSQPELPSPKVTYSESDDSQFDETMDARDNLASQLSKELAPAFDALREHQTQTVHDHVAEQLLLTTLLKVR